MGIDYAKHSCYLILLTVVSFGINKVLNLPPFEQKIIRKVKINHRVNLYITEASAGTTTAFSYRFYCMMHPKTIKHLWPIRRMTESPS